MIPTTPFLGLKPPLAETSRDRVLTDAELRLVWKAAEAVGFPSALWSSCCFSPVSERRGRQDGLPELDGSVWTIPAVRTKNSLEHVVPLPPQASAILDAVPRIAGAGYVFTRSGTTPAADYSAGKKAWTLPCW